MKKDTHKPKKVAAPRSRQRLDAVPKDIESISADDVQKLIEGLKIHQAELELQNEELRRAQSELQRSRDKYYELFDYAPVGYFSINSMGLITEVNLGGADLLGYTRRSLLHKGFSPIVTPDDRHTFSDHCKRVYETCNPQACELRLKRKDGSVMYAHLATNVSQDQESDDTILLIAVTDISRRKRSEDSLRESRSMLEIKVRERTEEIEDAYRELQLEIKAHQQASEEIRNLNQKLMESQEVERLMIARELHDSFAQELTAANMQCEHLLGGRYTDDAELKKGLKKVSDILSATISSVRELAYELRPAGLNQFGIVDTIQTYCDDYTKLNLISVDFKAAGFEKINLDDFTTINLYRLVQEGLLNVKKHADASLIKVRLVVSGKNILLRIHDDGKGFDVQQRLANLTKEKKLGLRSMQERINLLKGFMNIESAPGLGTKILLKIPIGN
ncbi:MAG: PAS domain S-box protein [Deltaproteobacteria bacterium]|nr:PAS domain S-box protein [Deltaproteobacteria bacterium]